MQDYIKKSYHPLPAKSSIFLSGRVRESEPESEASTPTSTEPYSKSAIKEMVDRRIMADVKTYVKSLSTTTIQQLYQDFVDRIGGE